MMGFGRAGIVLSPDLQYELAQLRGGIVSCPEDRQGRWQGASATTAVNLQGSAGKVFPADKPFRIIVFTHSCRLSPK